MDTTTKASSKKIPGIRVTTKKDGFRRGGSVWHGTVELPADEFTKDELAELKAEPMLIIEAIKIELAADAD